jgi:(E)-4-hydroxy-3-methylbut-2-enyl-diphosphate synthase
MMSLGYGADEVKRRKTRQISLGKLKIGGSAPVSIQSMTKTDTRDVSATVRQIRNLALEGCQIVRLAIPDTEAAAAIGKIKKRVNIPLVADIHFDYRLALQTMEEGIDGVRINPGNIKTKEKIIRIARRAKTKKIPIRIGVNAGSLDRKRYKGPLAPSLVKSAQDCIRIFEREKFYDIVISLKANDVLTTIEAYRLMAKRCNYPFHLGVTATGPAPAGIIKSAIGIGTLLLEGIGDTIRVSLTGPAAEEVKIGYEILRTLGLRQGIEIISCPTCGRCEVDLIKISREVKRALSRAPFVLHRLQPVKVAIMGCVVNGPGEAREADIGMAAGKRKGIIFKKGRVIKTVGERELVQTLLREIRELLL